MPRKLYPGEARKIRGLLEMGYSDLEISRLLHVARSSVANIRNEDQTYKTNKTLNERLCPDCRAPQSKWINTEDAEDHDINLTYEEKQNYDFVCPGCNELINIDDL